MRSGIANRGNLYRIKHMMRRARDGERLTIGFLGGSITQGSLAGKPELCYAYRVFTWWERSFPNAGFTYLNCGIGGTTSQFGAARAEEDLLSYRPDVVVVEFSVNDESDEHFLETYEGLIRKIYASETKPAILLVHNVFYNNGGNAQVQHGKVGRHYSLPCVSMQSSIYQEVVSGRLDKQEITPDDLHPNDCGHALVSNVITYFLDTVRQEMDIPEIPAPKLPKPITRNEYEESKRYQNHNCEPKLEGFTADAAAQECITDCFKNGWTAVKQGDKITFQIVASGIAVQYRKSVRHPAPVAEAVIDGNRENAVRLDANFNEDWGDKLELTTVAERLELTSHTVEVTIIEAHNDNAVPFYLTSVIGASARPILFLEPQFTHNIWGGAKLREEFGYCVDGDDIGECWGISAHENGDCQIRGGIYGGSRLSSLWKNQPELFGNAERDCFPLLVKLIDAREDLSIQVHPDDAYAAEHEHGSLGKTECWYVVDCPEHASLVIGHNAGTKEELEAMIETSRWNEFIREIPVQKGDLIQIEPGTVHAIKGGFTILETQQSSDITYRVYDYDRLSGGKPRKLHLKQSLDVITVPAVSAGNSIVRTAELPKNKLCELLSCAYYRVFRLDVEEKAVFVQKYPFLMMSVLEGEGTVDGQKVKKGDHFILTDNYGMVTMEGLLKILASTV